MTTIPHSVVETVTLQYEKAAEMVMRKIAPEYGLDGESVILTFDYGRAINWEVKRGEKITIVFGISPTDMRAFVPALRAALSFARDKKMRNCVSIESVNTIKARNDRYAEMFKDMRAKKLLPQSQLAYRKFTSIMVIDEKSGESVMVSGEDISIWDLQTEAHILLSKKVLGE